MSDEWVDIDDEWVDVPSSQIAQEAPDVSVYDWARATAARVLPDTARLGTAAWDWLEQDKDFMPEIPEFVENVPIAGLPLKLLNAIDEGSGTRYAPQFNERIKWFEGLIDEQVPMDPHSLAGRASHIVAGLPRMGATMAIAPQALIPHFAGEAYLGSYGAMRDAGADAPTASRWAAPPAAVAGVTGALIPGAIGKSGQSVGESILTHGVKTPAVMGLMAAPSYAANTISHAGATGQIPDDISGGLVDSMVDGALTGVLFGGLGAVKQAAGTRAYNKQQKVEAAKMKAMEEQVAKAEKQEAFNRQVEAESYLPYGETPLEGQPLYSKALDAAEPARLPYSPYTGEGPGAIKPDPVVIEHAPAKRAEPYKGEPVEVTVRRKNLDPDFTKQLEKQQQKGLKQEKRKSKYDIELEEGYRARDEVRQAEMTRELQTARMYEREAPDLSIDAQPQQQARVIKPKKQWKSRKRDDARIEQMMQERKALEESIAKQGKETAPKPIEEVVSESKVVQEAEPQRVQEPTIQDLAKGPEPKLPEKTVEVTFEPTPGRRPSEKVNKFLARVRDNVIQFQKDIGIDSPVDFVEPIRLAIKPDWFQHRKDLDNVKAGTRRSNRLKGEWDWGKAQDILVYEPKNPRDSKWGLKPEQDLIVVDGHHSYEFGQKKGIEVYRIQRLREADGVTIEQAKAIAADRNIARGTASLKDQVQYLKSLKESDGAEAAEQYAQGLRETTKQGQRIALAGSEGLVASYLSGKITPAEAEVIAKAAPNDPTIQRVGIKWALEKDVGIRDLEAQLQYVVSQEVRAETGNRGEQTTIGDVLKEQAKASGKKYEDTEAASWQESIEAGKRIRAWRRYFKAHLDVVAKAGSDKQVKSITRHDGRTLDTTDPKSPEYQAYKKEVATELERWQHFAQHADLSEIVKTKKMPPTHDQAGVDVGNQKTSAEIASTIDKTWADPKLTGEEGFVTLDLLLGGLGKKKKDNPLRTESYLPESERFFQGKFDALGAKDVRIPGYAELRGAFHKYISFPSTIASKFPEFAETWNLKRTQWASRDKTAFRLAQTMTPYFELQEPLRAPVDRMLAIARERGKGFNPSNEVLAGAGLNELQIKAYKSVRAGMDESLILLGDSLKQSRTFQNPEQQQMWNESVEKFVTGLRQENFVPFSRFGEFSLYVPEANEGRGHYSFHKTRGEARKAATEFESNGLKTEIQALVKPHRLKAANDIPPELLARMKNLDRAAFDEFVHSNKASGFAQHFAHAKLTPGYEQNFARSIADYITKISNYSAYKMYEQPIQQSVIKIPDKLAGLKRYAEKYIDTVDDIDDVNDISRRLRVFYGHYYLGFNAKSAAVNMTQSLTTTWPMLSKYTKSPLKEWRTSMKLTSDYLFKKEAFQKKNPELYKALEDAVEKGYVSAQQIRELYGLGRTGKKAGTPETIAEASMWMFSAAEKLNRVHAFISGYRVAPKEFSRAERIEFAEQFIDKTQFIYDRSNLPQAFRGKMAPLFTFRAFAGNWIRLMRNEWNWNPTKNKVGNRMLATMLGFGGTAAFPLAGALEKGLIAAGYDPKKAMRESFGDASDLIMYGLPTLLGMNISGAVAPFMMDPGWEANPGMAIARTAIGVPLDIPQRVFGKAPFLMDQTQDPRRALEPLLPEAARNMAVAARGAWDDGWRTPQGELIHKPSLSEMIVKGAGFTPSNLQKGYEKKHSSIMLRDRIAENRKHYNRWIGQAFAKGDIEEAARLMEEVVSHNAQIESMEEYVPLSKRAIKEAMIQYMNSDAYQMRRMPKTGRPELQEIQEAFR